MARCGTSGNSVGDYFPSSRKVPRPVTLIHMSDNGDTWWYLGRPGWSEVASGEFQHYLSASGRCVPVYQAPQHWTAWCFEPPRG